MSGKINLTRLYTLLAVWIVLLAIPGVLELSGAFGHFDVNSAILGSMIGVWIVGYLAQFGIFMWISRIVDPGMLAWFAASLLPWAIDWTTPVSPLFLCLWLAVAIAFAVWIASHARREESLREHGVHATGTVLEVYQPFMNVIVNGAYIKRKLRLRISGFNNVPAYEATFSDLFMFGDVPSVGDKIPLLVDPQNPQRFEYDASNEAGDASSDDLPSSTDDSASTADDGSGSIVADLAKLAKLHEQGALNDDEFNAAKRKLLI